MTSINIADGKGRASSSPPKKQGKVIQISCMWKDYLKNIDYCEWVAPVNLFKYAPFASSWETFAIQNMKIELPNPMCSPERPVNWVGTILCYAGYKALVVYYPMSTSSDAPVPESVSTWIQFCSSIPKPLCYSITENVALHPPTERPLEASVVGTMVRRMFQEIMFKEGKQFETVRSDHENLVNRELARCASRFYMQEVVEIIDKNDISGYRLAVVNKIIGDRIFITYLNESKTDQGFVISQNSPHVHKLGWCEAIGSPLRNVDPDKMLNLAAPSLEDLEIPNVPPGACIQEQMIFEMRHPCLPWKICPGVCVKVLKHGYFVAETDWTRENTSVRMILHITSDYILPVGFCEENDIPFKVPLDAFPNHGKFPVNGIGKFSWEKYMKKKKLKAFDPKRIPKQPNKFMRGSKLEVVKISKPVLLRPATVTKVAGRLIQVHFDGKRKTDEWNYQWMSCESSNAYPVGYADMVWHGINGRPEPPLTRGSTSSRQ